MTKRNWAVTIGVVFVAMASLHGLASIHSTPPLPPLAFSGAGYQSLGTVKIPAGGAKLLWTCPTCTGLAVTLDIQDAANSTSTLDTLSMTMPFQQHPTYGANNSVEPGAYYGVTVDPFNASGSAKSVAWTITIVPNVAGQRATN